MAPIAFGVEQFFDWMGKCDRYVWVEIPDTLG
jgi:hypothetical protein